MQQHRTKNLRLILFLLVVVGPFLQQGVESFLTAPSSSKRCHANGRSFLQVSTPSSSSAASTSTTSPATNLEQKVKLLKAVLQKEYVSFFDPMERDYYSEKVTFDDPLSSLAGVDAYQKNVDMLAARTTFGNFVFRDASIILHSVIGGDVVENEVMDASHDAESLTLDTDGSIFGRQYLQSRYGRSQGRPNIETNRLLGFHQHGARRHVRGREQSRGL
jgi:hypothetical protein